MAEKKTENESSSELALIEKIIEEGGMVNNPTQVPYAKQLIGQFATELLEGLQSY